MSDWAIALWVILPVAGFAFGMSDGLSEIAEASNRLCERCEMRAWDEMWSPDGLGGHEILVCNPCYRELKQKADLEHWHTLHD